MTFKSWARDTGIRAVKTAAQTAVAVLAADQVALFRADLQDIALTALGAGVVSILQNLANLKTGPEPVPEVVHVVEPAADAGVYEA